MALLSVSNLVMSYGDHVVLDGVSLTLHAGERAGLVGRNGCGKSSLMKAIAGHGGLRADSGQVQVARGASVGYLTQDPQFDPEHTLIEEARSAMADLHELHDQMEQLTHAMAEATGAELERVLKQYEELESLVHTGGGYNTEHMVEQTLHGVGLEDRSFDVKVRDLSGGQKGRLMLAKLLLAEPAILLLDEPTNHLDIAGRQWLEEYLKEYRGAVLLVSHDRWLLDRVVHRIYEMDRGRLEEYPGNYEQYREQRALRRLTQKREYEKHQDRVRQEQAFIDRYRAGQRAKQAKGREKRLERFVEQEKVEKPVESGVMAIRLPPAQRCGDLVLRAEHVSKAYDEGKRVLFRDIDLVVRRGDRIGVIGPNGAGKTTLVRCLIEELEPDSGKTTVGAQVSIGYYRQTHDHLDGQRTVVEHLARAVSNMAMQDVRNLAGAFLFSGDEQDKPLGVLSGGERARAALAVLVAGGHNLLILDEPSNHLDIPSAERLEEALRQFTAEREGWGESTRGGGTLILITHDRALLDHLVNQLLVFDGHGNVRHFWGTYSDYLAAEQAASAPAAAPPPKPAAPAPKPRTAPAKPVPKGKRFPGLSTGQIEKRIMVIESELASIDAQLADPQMYRDGEQVRQLQQRRQRLAAELTPLEEEWQHRAG